MSLSELSPHYVRAIAPYQPGKPISELAREMGLNEADIVKLASNENPLGIGSKARRPSPAMAEISLYPDGNGFALKSALAARLDVGLDQIVLGNGSNDVLDLVARAFLARAPPPSIPATPSPSIPWPPRPPAPSASRRRPRISATTWIAMLARVRGHTRVVWIANPNNPTGTLLDNGALHGALPPCARTEAVVVLDEAYVEYMDPARRAPSLQWLEEFPNLILTRTFSKAYGLAGLRVGYAAAGPRWRICSTGCASPSTSTAWPWPPPPPPSTTRSSWPRPSASTMPA
jgi:histidinol-phosphate aminotransferase